MAINKLQIVFISLYKLENYNNRKNNLSIVFLTLNCDNSDSKCGTREKITESNQSCMTMTFYDLWLPKDRRRMYTR